jgi:hypothetical protein
MRIKLLPQRRDDLLAVSKAGDVLTINGEAFDFSDLPEGATLPRGAISCSYIGGAVERVDGELIVPLILPHGPNPTPELQAPSDIENVPDGPVELPK